MIRIQKRPAAADGDEARIAGFGEDHGCPFLSSRIIEIIYTEMTEQLEMGR
jgi:hypothetical protein